MKRHVRNGLVLVAGAALIVSVVRAALYVTTSMNLANDLLVAGQLAQQDKHEEAARLALSVLSQEEQSVLAAYVFACSGWQARYFDDAAAIIHAYSSHGVTLEVVDKCIGSMPVGGLLFNLGQGETAPLAVRDRERDPVTPSLKDLARFADPDRTGAEQIWQLNAALICHNKAAGFPRLAQRQLQDMAEVLTGLARGSDGYEDLPAPQIEAVLADLPEEWGCASVRDFDIE